MTATNLDIPKHEAIKQHETKPSSEESVEQKLGAIKATNGSTATKLKETLLGLKANSPVDLQTEIDEFGKQQERLEELNSGVEEKGKKDLPSETAEAQTPINETIREKVKPVDLPGDIKIFVDKYLGGEHLKFEDLEKVMLFASTNQEEFNSYKEKYFIEEKKSLNIEQKYKKGVDQEQVEKRRHILREAPIYDNIQSALGTELYQRYEERTLIEDPLQIHPRFAELLKENPSLKIEAIKNSDGTINQYVMSAKINDRLSSTVLLDIEVKNAEEVTLGGGLDRPVYDYLVANKSLIVNQDGKVLDLDNYLPEHPLNKEKEVRVLLTDLRSSFARTSPRRIVIAPLISLDNVGAFMHEGGHMAAYDISRYATKYSTDRDAAAYLMTAVRELEKRGFLNSHDTKQIIEIQRAWLEAYQEAQWMEVDEKEGPFINVLSGMRTYTKEATNLSRSLEMQRRNPERKKTKGFKELQESLKELVPNLISQAKHFKDKYGLNDGKMNMLKSEEFKFFRTGNYLFNIETGLGEITLSEYSLTKDNKLHVKRYFLDKYEMDIAEGTYNEETQYFDRRSKLSLCFDREKKGSEMERFIFEKAKKKMVDLFDCVEKGQVEVVGARPMDIYSILGREEGKSAV